MKTSMALVLVPVLCLWAAAKCGAEIYGR